MGSMLALRAHHRGGPEVVTVEQAPVPVPARGEVLVEVHAAAITFDELTWDETWSRGCRPDADHPVTRGLRRRLGPVEVSAGSRSVTRSTG